MPVSIHATLAGGDSVRFSRCCVIVSFYPRHPRGWRLADLDKQLAAMAVSIHATLAGGDQRL